MKIIDKAKLISNRCMPSLTNFKNEYVYVSGGMNPESKYIMASVDRYEISTNTWSKTQPMTKPRSCHSSCALNDFIFVFCGIILNFREF